MRPGGPTAEWAVDRWSGPITCDDAEVLERARPPVLDIGCGPGRHVLALATQGKVALGIDLTKPAVAMARDRGAPVLHRSVFARVPGAGRWRTALLLDGNIGIGGDPRSLLARVASLLAGEGVALLELDPPGTRPVASRARLAIDGDRGPWFSWTQLSVDDLGPVAYATGFAVVDMWRRADRWFAELCCNRIAGSP
jgi:SAM-dependent methyltransferase